MFTQFAQNTHILMGRPPSPTNSQPLD